jgi:hypothetical protein
MMAPFCFLRDAILVPPNIKILLFLFRFVRKLLDIWPMLLKQYFPYCPSFRGFACPCARCSTSPWHLSPHNNSWETLPSRAWRGDDWFEAGARTPHNRINVSKQLTGDRDKFEKAADSVHIGINLSKQLTVEGDRCE